MSVYRCYNCMYWVKNIGTERLGECRVDSPGINHDGRYGRWPLTSSESWCGRFSDVGDRESDRKVSPIIHIDASEFFEKLKELK